MISNTKEIIDSYFYERDLLLKEEPNPMFYSSFLFLTNVLIAYNYNYYTYSALFAILFITSIVVHSYDIFLTNIIDKISVIAVTLYGGYIFINKNITLLKNLAIISTFLTVVYVYTYGYYTNNYCFHEDKDTRQLYHPFMHVISSLGHHLIMLA
uniref:Uncharacterized protein n=1 Tax=viral metagenome TaxID=1070528 RepID=A0A6C0I9Q1_9ZZZZ